MTRTSRALWATVLACAGALTLVPVAAGAAAIVTPAATDSSPPLSVPQAKLDAAVKCGGGALESVTRAPVMLVQGTGATAQENWEWNYERALPAAGIAWCHVDVPMRAQGDLQENAEYVVSAIRMMHRRSGRRISIIGHSQGGMSPRWAMRWFPDTRAMVDDLIGFAPSNHGTTLAASTCSGGCSPSNWQQTAGSKFLTALNHGAETWAGISYTSVYTRLDQIVVPNQDESGSSSLRTGEGRRTNVATQDICPTDPYEHLSIGTLDPVAYALAIDALGHDGPAEPKRIDRRVCAQVFMPGVNPATAAQDIGGAATGYLGGEGGADSVAAEPALRCYVTGSCPAGAPASAKARLAVSLSPRRVRMGRGVVLRVRVRSRASTGARLAAVRGALVRVGSRRVRTSASGRAVLRARFARPGRVAVRASAPGHSSRSALLRIVR